MTYEEFLEELKGMPYLNARIEKRINCQDKLWSRMYLSDLDDSLQIDILNELYTDADTKESMMFVVKEAVEDAIVELQEILEWIEEQ